MHSNVAEKAEPGLGERTSDRTDEVVVPAGQLDWQSVDRALRRIRKHRDGLDAEEARWLREAETLQIWRPLGMVSALDYLERVMGYPPRAGQERLRVAQALGALPELTAALTRGALAYSAVRELSRIVTPATEAEWLSHAFGKNLREIEDMVSGRRPGDRPDDPPDPDVRTRVVRLELSGESYALFRQAHGALNEEHGRHLDDDELVHALCSAALEGAPAGESTGRARFQIGVTVCRRCKQGWQDGAGARTAVSADAVDRAMCDAQHIGSVDGDAPERATQDVPPSVMRLVKQRDGGRCQVPGCRSARGLEVHHIVHRADGGGHDPNNLLVLCSACHLAHHRGTLTLSGTADRLEVRRPGVTDADDTAIGEQRQRVALDASPPAATSSTTSAPSKLAAATQRVANKRALAEQQSVGANASRSGASEESPSRCDEDVMSSSASAVAAAPTHKRCGKVRGSRAAEQNPHVGSQRRKVEDDNRSSQHEDCKRALVGLGWKSQIALAATTAALEALGEAVPLERLIADALRRCPRPVM